MIEPFFRVKKGVILAELHPAVSAALFTIADTVTNVTGRVCVFTSGRDGKHSKGSDHYLGRALDVRTWYWVLRPSKVQELASALRGLLGPDWFVLVERTHIHLSYRGDGYELARDYWRPKAGAAPHEEDL